MLLVAAPQSAQPTTQQAGTLRSALASTPSGQQMVDALHTAYGEHRARAVHAMGVMAMGDFTPAPNAVALSNAALFRGGPIPVLVRFSDFTGIPDIPDNIGAANPRGLARKFTLTNGATTVSTRSWPRIRWPGRS